MKYISDIDVGGKKVVVRADLDVPLGFSKLGVFEDQNPNESTRLKHLKDTVDLLLSRGARQVVIIGHIDRPKKADPALSTEQLIKPLSVIFRKPVAFKKSFESKMDGQIVLFENLRFWPGEVGKEMDFANKLAGLGDIYVNDALSASHRDHSSMSLLPTLLPAVCGERLRREIKELGKLINNPQKPFVAIVGGAKIETKVPVISHLSKIADYVLVGGELPIEIEKSGEKFEDNVVVARLNKESVDISDQSIVGFKKYINGSKTIVWNGPMGLFEEGHRKGTMAIANTIIESGAYSVVGGGETTQFLASAGLLDKFSFVSSGGGAMLAFLAGKELPGIRALG